MTQYLPSRFFAIAVCAALFSSAAYAQESEYQTRPRLTPTQSVKSQQAALTSYFASKLFLANHSAIELSQMATEQTSNDTVQEFAEMLQGEHQNLLEQLRTMVPADLASTAKQRIAESDADDLDDPIQFADDDIDELQQDDIDADASERTVVGRAVYSLSNDPVLRKICEIDRLASKNRLASEMKLLKRNRGIDFDVNFIGLQIATHSNLLAELKAVKNTGTPEFQKIVAKATKMVESHLEEAQEIADEIGTDTEQDDEEQEDDFGNDDDDQDDGTLN